MYGDMDLPDFVVEDPVDDIAITQEAGLARTSPD
jgi:hypothetical protein